MTTVQAEFGSGTSRKLRGKSAPQKIDDTTAILRPKAASLYTGLSVAWFKADRARDVGPKIPYVQLTERAIGYERAALDRFLAARIRGASQTAGGSDARAA